MFRTRDFVLLFTCIVFLVAAIGATMFQQWWSEGGVDPVVSNESFASLASTSEVILTGTVPGSGDIDRAANLESMKAKIAQAELTQTPQLEPEEPVVSTTATATSSDEVEETVGTEESAVMTCGSYASYLGFWDARNASVAVKEGAIVVERPVGTSTEVILQLPARTMPAATPTCVGSDVIGIANDGSLIRNDEFAFYGVFGAETRVGYALDGLPIHGVGTTRGDVCGGRVVAGQYRYELSSDRTTLINCFAGTPTRLP